MKNESKEIEINDGVEALGEIVKKSGEVAVLGDGFGYFEQGFELTPGMFERRNRGDFGRGNNGIRHRSQNSIRLARVSTKLTPEP